MLKYNPNLHDISGYIYILTYSVLSALYRVICERVNKGFIRQWEVLVEQITDQRVI